MKGKGLEIKSWGLLILMVIMVMINIISVSEGRRNPNEPCDICSELCDVITNPACVDACRREYCNLPPLLPGGSASPAAGGKWEDTN
ncbi:hypothetical protein ABFS83_09G096100 [Erythranthe nasuta]